MAKKQYTCSKCGRRRVESKFPKWYSKQHQKEMRYTLCEDCHRDKALKHWRAKADGWKLEGGCIHCGETLPDGCTFRTCEACRKKMRGYGKTARYDVLRHYSDGDDPKCRCCGESNMAFLTIDHINGGGTKQRGRELRGSKLFWYLKKNGYPDGYRVLCMNCNFSLGQHGYCPHQIEGLWNYATDCRNECGIGPATEVGMAKYEEHKEFFLASSKTK